MPAKLRKGATAKWCLFFEYAYGFLTSKMTNVSINNI